MAHGFSHSQEEGKEEVVVVEEEQEQASGGEPPRPSNTAGRLYMGTALAQIIATMLKIHKTDADIFKDPVRFWDWTRNGCDDPLLRALGNHALFGEVPDPASSATVLDAGQGDGLAKQQLAAKLDTWGQRPDRGDHDLCSGDVGDHTLGPEASGGELQGCCKWWSKSGSLWHPTWLEDLLVMSPAAEVPAMFRDCAPSGSSHQQAVPGTSGGQPRASAPAHSCSKGHKDTQVRMLASTG